MGFIDRLKQAFGGGAPARVRVVGGAALHRTLVEDALEEEGWLLTAEGPVDFVVVFAPAEPADESPAHASPPPLLPSDVGPQARVLLVAPVQLSSDQIAALADEVRACGWLPAPFTREDLVDEIRRCVALTPHEAAEFRRGLRSEPSP